MTPTYRTLTLTVAVGGGPLTGWIDDGTVVRRFTGRLELVMHVNDAALGDDPPPTIGQPACSASARPSAARPLMPSLR